MYEGFLPQWTSQTKTQGNFTMGRPFPLKVAPSHGDLDPHL